MTADKRIHGEMLYLSIWRGNRPKRFQVSFPARYEPSEYWALRMPWQLTWQPSHILRHKCVEVIHCPVWEFILFIWKRMGVYLLQNGYRAPSAFLLDIFIGHAKIQPDWGSVVPQLVEGKMLFKVSVHKIREVARQCVRKDLRDISALLNRLRNEEGDCDCPGSFIGLRW